MDASISMITDLLRNEKVIRLENAPYLAQIIAPMSINDQLKVIIREGKVIILHLIDRDSWRCEHLTRSRKIWCVALSSICLCYWLLFKQLCENLTAASAHIQHGTHLFHRRLHSLSIVPLLFPG